MKILLFAPEWFGGVQHYTEKALEKLGCEVVSNNYNYRNSPRFSVQGQGKQYTQSAAQRPVRALVRQFFPGVSKIKNRFAQGNIEKNIQIINDDLLKQAVTEKPDLLMVIKGEIIFPETIEAIREKLKIPICAWWLDSPFIAEGSFPYSLKTISLYDHIFIFDKHYRMSLREMGVNSSYLPNCVDESVFSQQELDDKEASSYGSDVAFMGAGYLNRILILEKMLDFDFKLWGIGYSAKFSPKQAGKFSEILTERIISPIEATKIYSSVKIMLNFHHHQCFFGPNQKVFEIAACGGFQLAQHLPFFDEMFDVGTDFICYHSLDDLRDKVVYFLENKQERTKIASKTRDKVLASHTYKHRMTHLLDKLHLL